MVKKWSYLSSLQLTNVNKFSLKADALVKRHTFKVFKKTTRFKRHSTGISTVVRLKTMKITRKTEKLALSIFIGQWSKIYMRSKQFYRYYQSIGLFNTVMPTFAPDSIKAILLKTNPVNNIFFFSCSKNVLLRYVTYSNSINRIKAPTLNSRNCYATSTGLDNIENFDQVSSSVVFLDQNFYIPNEIILQNRSKNILFSQLNNSLFNYTLILNKIIRQILIKLSLLILV